MSANESYTQKGDTEITPLERLYGPGAKIVNGILVVGENEENYKTSKPSDPQF